MKKIVRYIDINWEIIDVDEEIADEDMTNVDDLQVEYDAHWDDYLKE